MFVSTLRGDKMGAFDNDLLNRDRYARFLLTLLRDYNKYKRNNESQAFVMAIDSPWGTGKTHFVNSFDAYLKEQNNGNEFTVIRYNAWENDFWLSAFDPLMRAIFRDEYIMATPSWASKWESIKKSIYEVSKGILYTPLTLLAGERATDQVSKTIDHLLETSSSFEEFENFIYNIAELKNALIAYREFLYESLPGHSLVIILDELDRCKPIFAIQTLEIVKHLFNINNIIFIFALDLRQLSCSVKAVYGNEMDATGYLTRFFDYISKIPEGETHKYCKVLCEKICSESIAPEAITQVQIYFESLSRQCHLSLRDMETIYSNFILLVDFDLKKQLLEVYQYYLWLISLKYKDPINFSKMVTGQLNIRHGYGGSDCGRIIAVAPVSREKMLSAMNQELCDIDIFVSPKRLMPRNARTADLRVINIKSDCIEYGHSYNNSKDVVAWESIYEGITINNIITLNDIRKWEDIKHLTLGHYLQRKLEMFDFSFNSPKIIQEETVGV